MVNGGENSVSDIVDDIWFQVHAAITRDILTSLSIQFNRVDPLKNCSPCPPPPPKCTDRGFFKKAFKRSIRRSITSASARRRDGMFTAILRPHCVAELDSTLSDVQRYHFANHNSLRFGKQVLLRRKVKWKNDWCFLWCSVNFKPAQKDSPFCTTHHGHTHKRTVKSDKREATLKQVLHM